ncbi:RNA polymerase sigma factor SigI [Niallia sp. Krafla_26]|uniref:RNA polymerase sigma factor SigI n=1 Tax=Niallia sp. Krafla_26 TaxID=3064703 RepID=UPI003D17926D
MLGLKFKLNRKKKFSLEENVYLIQQGNVKLQNELIHSYKPFIAKTVSSVCKRYIHETDDEFSIGLIAFNEAIQKYNVENGSSLLRFAETLIKRKVIDYIRTQSKTKNVSFDIEHSFEDGEFASTSIDDKLSIEAYKKKTDDELRKEEIHKYTEELNQYGISFSDLLQQSPKHADARKNAMTVAEIIAKHDDLKEIFLTKRKLPIKQLETKVDISRKTIERNRKYIMAMTIIFIGDFIFLKDYIKGVLDS